MTSTYGIMVEKRDDAVARLELTGCLPAARYIDSPNRDARPAGSPIDLLVIHNISLPPGVFAGDAIIDLFTNRLDASAHAYFAGIAGLRVSSHLLIRRDGVALQFVRCGERAWHAGTSSWRGRERCNDFSIGIEMEGTDELPYTIAQYARLIGIAQLLLRAYPIRHVAGHSDIAPERKTDPGPHFDWRLLREATGLL